jgi:hypothetical protein
MIGVSRQLAGAALALVVTATGVLVAMRGRDADWIEHLGAVLERGARGYRADRFDPAMAAGMPEPAGRYLLHAIRPGTPLAQSARLEMQGEMRLGPGRSWLPLRASQMLAPPSGFVWEACLGTGLLGFVGADGLRRLPTRRPVSLRRSPSGPSRASPSRCWSGRWTPRCRPAGSCAARCTAATGSCAAPWKSAARHTHWPSRGRSSRPPGRRMAPRGRWRWPTSRPCWRAIRLRPDHPHPARFALACSR